jgi:hypothetical protein
MPFQLPCVVVSVETNTAWAAPAVGLAASRLAKIGIRRINGREFLVLQVMFTLALYAIFLGGYS